MNEIYNWDEDTDRTDTGMGPRPWEHYRSVPTVIKLKEVCGVKGIFQSLLEFLNVVSLLSN